MKRTAEKEMDRLPADVFTRVAQAIEKLEREPRPVGARKLRGTAQRYRLRVGDYRVLYGIDDLKRMVAVVAVGHRRDVYRGI